jgi:heme-binding protein
MADVGGRAFRALVAAVVVAATGGLLAACATAPPAKPAAVDGAPTVALDPIIEPVMARACYPCHSDVRRDPWYAKIAPSSWSLDGARRVLDFSQWDRYDAEHRTTAAAMIADAVARGSMPPADYTFFNHGARLEERDRQAVATWAASAH